MKILCFAGSLRVNSLNKKYAKVAAKLLEAMPDVEVEYVDLLDYPMPVFNQDIQDKGFPAGVLQLAEKVKAADAVVVSTPEYNGSISSVFKTVIDWLSREPINPWPGKHILLLGASPGAMGAVLGLYHTRQPLQKLGCHVYPEMSGLQRAGDAFDDQGELKDAANQARLTNLVNAFVAYLR